MTDTEVTVGILHFTGTMAISETGSVQAEKLAIEQINAAGGVSDARSNSSKRMAAAIADVRREGESPVNDKVASVMGC